ncbi:MAG: hypothetical protein ACI9AV_002265 [Sediminicola sp.]|jgi:hypothetical protein
MMFIKGWVGITTYRPSGLQSPFFYKYKIVYYGFKNGSFDQFSIRFFLEELKKIVIELWK